MQTDEPDKKTLDFDINRIGHIKTKTKEELKELF